MNNLRELHRVNIRQEATAARVCACVHAEGGWAAGWSGITEG